MIETVVRDFLASVLSEPVFMEYPTEHYDRFVVLRKAGSTREDLIDTAMFVADSYGESMYEAARLNAKVVAAFDGLTDLERISSTRHGGDYQAADTQHKRYRYQAICNVTHY